MNSASLARQILSSLVGLPCIVAGARGQDASAPRPDAQAAREQAFAEKMSGCKMVGYFTVSDPPRKNAAAREESYTIAKAEKLRDDKWRFTAKIAYNGREVTLPIVVSVLWAGDTPVIQVTKIPVPTMGVYTARVLVYDTHYAG
ncbi:MAG: hypothetical protein H6833_02585, partial [Planctomycetes bacterium]|nr:hypothetical protein [Planctomycetota bacterium]